MKGRKHLRANDQLITNGQHNKEERKSAYLVVTVMSLSWDGEREKKKKKKTRGRHGDALDQEQKKK